MAVPACDHFARLGGARHHGAVEGRGDDQILPVVLGFRKLEAGLLSGRASRTRSPPAAARFACAPYQPGSCECPDWRDWPGRWSARRARLRDGGGQRPRRRSADRRWSMPACPGVRRRRRFSPAFDKHRYRTAPAVRMLPAGRDRIRRRPHRPRLAARAPRQSTLDCSVINSFCCNCCS